MNSFGFGKKQRLLNASEFKTVFDAPTKKVHSQHFILIIQKNNQSYPRLGLAITKKKIKNASDRNLVKRKTREIFRQYQHKISAADIILVVKMRFDGVGKQDLRMVIDQELKNLFIKLVEINLA